MTPLELINSIPLPFAKLMGVIFTEAAPDKVVATMVVREDLCTVGHAIHGGAVMALADSVGAAATVINLPEGAKGTTTIESKTNFVGAAAAGVTARPAHAGLDHADRDRGGASRRSRHADADGIVELCVSLFEDYRSRKAPWPGIAVRRTASLRSPTTGNPSKQKLLRF